MGLITEHAEQDSLGGGRYRQTIAGKRIARRVDGNLVRLLNRVGATGDPALPLGVSELFDVRFRDRLSGQAPVFHVGRGAQQIRLTPLDTNIVNGEVFGENGYRYPGAWDGADLSYQIGGHVIREAMLLRTGHPSRFQFRLDSYQGFDPTTLSGPEFRILQPSLDGPNGQHIPLVWTVSEIGGHKVLTVELPPGDYAGWVVDPTLTLQPDATDGKDNYMVARTGNPGLADANVGTGTDAYSGDLYSDHDEARRPILQFDVSSIPATATVDAVTFSLWEWAAATGGGAPASWSVALRRVLRSWGELTCTWNKYDGTNSWTTGGCGSDGNDRAAVDSASVTADGTSANAFVDWAAAQLVADVQNFVSGTWTNDGWLVQAPDAEWLGVGPYAYTAYWTSDYTTANQRPKLVVEYTEAAANNGRMMMMGAG